MCYDFNSQDWSVSSSFGYSSASKSADTNMVTTSEGKLFFYRSNIPSSTNYPHNNSSAHYARYIDAGLKITFTANHTGTLKTKEIDFGDMGSLKHVYKVIVKYKRASDSAGATNGVTVSAVINGNYGTLVNFTTNTKYLTDTGTDWQIHECIPDNANDFKNIKSLALNFACGDTTHSDFEIDNIAIVYRVKGVST